MLRISGIVFIMLVFLAACSSGPAAITPLATRSELSYPETVQPTFEPPTPTPLTASPQPEAVLNRNDLVSVIGRMAFALESKQPDLLGELVSERGVAYALMVADQTIQPGYDNRAQFIENLDEGLQNTEPICSGYNPHLSTQDEIATVVFHGVRIDWQAQGAEENLGESVLITLQKGTSGWEIIMISPLYTEQQLAQIGDQLPCPGSNRPGILPSQGAAVQLQHLTIFDSKSGWAITRQGHILRTEQGMQAWQDMLPDLPDGQYFQPTAFFYDLDTAVVMFAEMNGTPPVTRRTEDGGQTWIEGGSLPAVITEGIFPLELWFVDPLHGWFLGQVYTGMHHVEVVLFETLDGGLNWILIHTSHPDFAAPSGSGFLRGSYSLPYGSQLMQFISDTQGFASNGALYATIDSGRYWVPVTLPLPENYPNLVNPYEFISPPWFSTSQDGFLLMRVYEFQQVFLPPGDLFDGLPKALYIYFSHDGGQSWTPSPVPSELGRAYFIDGNTGWFLSETGLLEAPGSLYFTEDGGVSWDLLQEQTPFPAGAQLLFIDKSTGWVLLGEAEPYTGVSMYQTADGGLTWGALVPRLHP